jgi:hypothetical protein
MALLTSIVIFIILSVIIMRAYNFIVFAAANNRMIKKRFARIDPLFYKLKNNELVTKDYVYAYAKDLLTREITFKLLQLCNLTDLFPGEFNTFEKAAESNLANWLEFPTELNACPDEIEHIKHVTVDFDEEYGFLHYEVFKFRVNKPHWAANKGWMVGVVGPYINESKPYDRPSCTFSRFKRRADISPEEETKLIHQSIFIKKSTLFH